jgi:hypothetical protein
MSKKRSKADQPNWATLFLKNVWRKKRNSETISKIREVKRERKRKATGWLDVDDGTDAPRPYTV